MVLSSDVAAQHISNTLKDLTRDCPNDGSIVWDETGRRVPVNGSFADH
jgi:hypothetical protein